MIDDVAGPAKVKRAFQTWLKASRHWTDLRRQFENAGPKIPGHKIRALAAAEKALDRAADGYLQSTAAAAQAATADVQCGAPKS